MTKNNARGISPAALGALLRGDLGNAIVASTPGGIEAQEAAGQRGFVASDTLPIKCNFCTREQLEQMDIEFGDPVDDLFVEVRLPEGWKKERASHSMWSRLVDEKGRERASIFYKAAFYDRSAHISLSRRFSFRAEPVCGYDDPDYKSHEWHCVVTDCDQVIWTSKGRLEPEPETSYGGDESKRLAWLDWSNRKDDLKRLGEIWLDENHPDWRDPLACWD